MSQNEAKKHQASGQKLSKEREKGNVAPAAETTAFVSTALALLILVSFIPTIFRRLGSNFEIATNSFAIPFREAIKIAFSEVVWQLVLAVAPLVLASGLAAILTSLVYNKGLVFAMKPITPDIKRISPMAGLKRVFGKRSFLEVFIGCIRLGIWLSCSYFILRTQLPDILSLSYCGKPCTVDFSVQLLYTLVLVALLILVISIVVEMIMQKAMFMIEQMMTDSEVKKEQKEQVGSNEVRQERQRIRQELAQNAEHTSINKANMCFYTGDRAIAVRYHPDHASIPRIAAKTFTAEKSAKLRQKISENGFNELEHPDLVNAVKDLQPGQDIGAKFHPVLIDALKKLFST